MIDGWSSHGACDCYDPIPGSYELYECCFSPASHACGNLSTLSHFFAIYTAITVVFAFAYRYNFIYSDWALFCSFSFQIIILISRTYYWGTFSENQNVNWEQVVFWKAGTSITPLVHLGQYLYTTRVIFTMSMGYSNILANYNSLHPRLIT